MVEPDAWMMEGAPNTDAEGVRVCEPYSKDVENSSSIDGVKEWPLFSGETIREKLMDIITDEDGMVEVDSRGHHKEIEDFCKSLEEKGERNG